MAECITRELSDQELLRVVHGPDGPGLFEPVINAAIGTVEAAGNNVRKAVAATALTGAIMGAGVMPAAAHERGAAQVVRIERGDTLSGLAAEQGTTVNALASANGIQNIHRIQIGDTLTVTASSDTCATGQVKAQAGDTVTSLAPGQSAEFLAANPRVASSSKQWLYEGECYNQTAQSLHVVKKGDTVSDLAGGDQKLVQAIIEANGLTVWKDDVVIIHPGDELIIPDLQPAVTATADLDQQTAQLLGSEHRATIVLPKGQYISDMAKAVSEVTGVGFAAVQDAMLSANEGEHFQLGDPLDVPGFDAEIVNQALALLKPQPAEVSARTFEQLTITGLPSETVPEVEAMTPGALNLEPIYRQAEEATGVPWQVFAGIHFQEANNDPKRDLQAGNPLGTGGSLYSVRGAQPDLLTSLINAGNDLQHSAEHGRFRKRIDRSNLDLKLIKDVLLSHNGRSPQYARQAAKYGFDPELDPAEGSPYVVEGLTSEQRGMGRITRDHGGIDGVATKPGALTVAIGLGLLDSAHAVEQTPAPENSETDPRLAHELIGKEIKNESNGVQTVLVDGIRIRIEAAMNLAQLLEAAKADGLNLGSSPRGAHRSPEQQLELFVENGCQDGECDDTPVAKPGTSNHESHPDDPLSYAVDFRSNGLPILSWNDWAAEWLQRNAGLYDFFGKIPSEPWHWSGTGR